MSGEDTMEKVAISTEQAPKAIGPYSQGIAVGSGRMVFLSGQIPLDPTSGNLVSGDITEQTRRVMDNLGAVLDASQLTFANVVRTTIYLVDLADYPAVNTAYAAYFSAAPPARSTVQVAALPKGARIEIDAIAVAG